MADMNQRPDKKSEPAYKTLLKQKEKQRKVNNQRLQGQTVDTAISPNGVSL